MNKPIGAIDIGGTSIKHAIYVDGNLIEKGSVPTPKTLEDYYTTLEAIVSQMKTTHDLAGVAMSTPGAVNKEAGIIEGASALPYIHDFPIQQKLEALFALPVSMENDANCAALAEVKFGAAKGYQNVLFVVLGTGVGGSVIVDGKIRPGKHLFGGEFGFMLMNDHQTFSEVGTAVNMAARYNRKVQPKQPLTGEEVFQKYFEGDADATIEAEIFFSSVAQGIFNLQYAFDPERIVIGGGVSQAPYLLEEIDKRMQKILDAIKIAPFKPEIVTCQYRNDANLIGAVADFLTTEK